MTSKQIYEATAIELSRVQAPALKLYEFNYLFNQAIRQFVNKVYNIYDVNQQTTDDLRVLKSTATLVPTKAETTGIKAIDYLTQGTYYVTMPSDYLHLLNCICLFDVKKNKDCWNSGDVMVVGATKLTADGWSSVIDDVYNRPTKKRPYYYIHNQNDIHLGTDENNNLCLSVQNEVLPTKVELDTMHNANNPAWGQILEAVRKCYFDPSLDSVTKEIIISAAKTKVNALKSLGNIGKDEDIIGDIIDDIDGNEDINSAQDTYEAFLKARATEGTYNFPRTFDFALWDKVDQTTDVRITQQDAVEKPAGSRHANSSRVKIEIRCGRDKSDIFSLSAVQIDYIKAPQFIRLTQEQLDSDEDISQIMEFPDYVNQEIINELVNLVMRKINDPSLQAHMQITQSIARPTGQQTQQPATQG